MFVGQLNLQKLSLGRDPLAHLVKPLQSKRVAAWADDFFAAAQIASPNDRASAIYPVTHAARFTLVGDVRLDNRRSLQSELGVILDETNRIDDAVIVLHAYEKWGPECLAKLYGDFAFVIWDAKQRRLFAARDAAGVQPFYYTVEGARLVFAAHQAAVYAGLPDKAINWLWVKQHLYRSTGDQLPIDATIFTALRRLPPGHALVFTQKGERVWRWWNPENLPKPHLGSLAQYEHTLRELLEQAVASRLPTDGQVRTHLSGGLGSSAVTVLAAQQLRKQNKPLSAYFWGADSANGRFLPDDERRLVKAICEQEGVACCYVSPTINQLADWRLQNAGAPPNGISVRELLVRQQARQDGVSVLLSGMWRNPLISRRHSAPQAGLRSIQEMLKPYRRKGQSAAKSIYNKLARRIRPKRTPTLDQKQSKKVSAWQPNVVAHMLQLPEESRSASGSYESDSMVTNGVRTFALEGWASGGWEAGIAYRYPLLDRRILEFYFSLPADLPLQAGYSNALFRQAVSDVLPKAICWRRGSHEPAVHAERRMLNDRFGQAIMRPRLEALMRERSEFHILNRQSVSDILEQCRQAPSKLAATDRLWWSRFLGPYRLERLLIEADLLI